MGIDFAVSGERDRAEDAESGINHTCSTSTYGLIDGGRAGMIYVYIGSFVGFFSVVISMAEIASM